MSSSIKFQCVDDSGNPIFLVDSTNGIYHKNTRNSSNASSGALLLYGGLSINSTTNSINVSSGGVLTVAGGASFGRDVYIGGDLRVYGSQTLGNVTLSNLTSGNILTNNINLGISNIYSGSFTSTNNQSISANVSGLLFPNASVSSFVINLTVNITTNSNNYYETFILEGTQTNSGWSLFSTNYGDNSGIVFSITSNGQIQYTSTNINNFTNGLFNFSVNQITKTGNYSYVNTTTQGTLVADVIQILSTNDSNLGVNNGGLYLLGGATILKSLYVGTLISSSNAILTNISSNTLNTSNILSSIITTGTLLATTISSSNFAASLITTGTVNVDTLVSSANISSSLITTGTVKVNTLISSANISASVITVGTLLGSTINGTNSTITNAVHTALSTGTLAATTSVTSAGLFALNVTGTNIVGTNISAGTIVGTTLISSANIAASVITAGTLLGTTLISSANIAASLITVGSLLAATRVSSANLNASAISAGTIVVAGNISANTHTSISTQGIHLAWNRSNADGESWIINQKGGGTANSGIRFGRSDSSNNVTELMRILDSGNVGIGTNNPGATLDVSGTFRATTSVTSGALYATNITSTNIVGTTISAGTIVGTTLISSANISTSLITAGTVNASTLVSSANIAASVITVGTLTSTTINGTNSTITNAVHTALSTGTLAATTSVTSAGLFASNVTGTNIVGTNISAGTIVGTTLVSSANIAASVITAGTLTSTTINGTNSTITNAVHTALSTGTLAATSVTSGGLFASNIVGTNFSTGTLNATTSITSGGLYATNIIATTMSIGTILGNTLISSANIAASVISSGRLNISTLISSANISSAIISTGTLVGSTININGTTRIINTSANSVGTLVVAGPGSSSYLPAITTIGQLMSIYGPGGSNSISNIDLSTFEPTPVAMSLPAVRFSMQDLGGNNSSFNILTKNVGNTGTMASRLFIDGSGKIGIATTSPGESLDLRGNLRIGNNTQSNYISFYGTYGDGVGEYSHTFIGERLYSGTEQSELLLFKGNDIGSSSAGPDRIRLLAAEHRFDTYTTNVSGSFENVASTVASNRMIINSAGNVGIGTASPIFTLDVSGTARFTTSLTSGALYANNITATNIVGISNISTGTLVATTSVTSAALYGLNITGTNIVGTNISSGTLLASTRVSSANINCNIISSATLITTNITSTNIVGASNISTATLVATTRVSSANLNTSIISTGTLIAINNSNTLGSLYTTGGNVGINKTNPQAELHIQATNLTSLLSTWSGAGSYSNIDFSYDNSNEFGTAASARIKVLDNDFGADIYIQNRDQGSDNSNMNTRLFIGATGNIGIGTENPSSKLDISTNDSLGLITNNNIGLRHTGFTTISSFPLTLATTQLETFINNKGAWLRTSTNDALNFAVNNGNSSLSINTSGNVGVNQETSSMGSFRGTFDIKASAVILTNTSYMSSYSQTISYDSATNGSLGIAFGMSSVNNVTPGAAIVFERTASTNVGLLHFITKSSTSATGSTPIRMTIQTSGNIGIGTTAPTVALDINNSTSQSNAPFLKLGNSAGGSGNQVGIKLSPYSSRAGGDSSQIIAIDDGASSSHLLFYTAASGAATTSTERMRITNNGNIGIGTNTPTYQLQLSSDSAAKPSTNTWTVSSDERLKTNIQLADLDICYNIIKNLPLKRYTWKDEVYTVEEVPDRSKLGWIAQDVESVIPKAVEKVSMLGYEDCRTLNSDQIIASLYGCVQKLIQINEYQDEHIHNLNETINKIVSENEIKNINMRQLIERITILEERIYNNFSA
jgi:hypothetical protein